MKNEYATTIKSDINSRPDEIMNRYMNNFTDLDYSLTQIYIGVVVDNNDPEKLGRCRIRVFNIFDTIPEHHIPWAVPDFDFIGSNKGSFIVPPVGCIVSVYFDRGEIYLPRYTNKVLNTQQLPSRKDVDYPDNMVFFETDNGDSFELNRRRRTATYTHSSGTQIFINADGSVNINSVANITTNHEDLLTINGNVVTPTGIGPLCAVPICPLTGAFHTGTVCNSINTVSVGGSVDREVV